ncbi:uncharacterized protein LOC123383245 isoform X2 [Felis catus]|uniref:uncharacterized protein LOC123383245 isoform X2 n=1 Tax=Felis catus TaxID=9685 RepID=UPI001D19E46C|nr:uncharacterized protein LOC123383245 isoform X2 [Felis catus]
MDDRPSLSARDCVESLHQNSRATLLYGHRKSNGKWYVFWNLSLLMKDCIYSGRWGIPAGISLESYPDSRFLVGKRLEGVAKVKKQRSLPVLSRQAVAEVIVRAMENGVAKVKKQRSLPVLSRQAVAEVATGAMEYGVPKEEKVWAVRVRRHQGVAEDLVSRMKKKKCSPEVKNINWHQAVLQKTPHLANNRGYSINDPIECIF